MLKSLIVHKTWCECDAKGCGRRTDPMDSQIMGVEIVNALGWRQDPETKKVFCPNDVARAEACGHQLVKIDPETAV